MAGTWESAPQRAYKDFKAWLPRSLFVWILLVVVSLGAGVIVSAFIAPNTPAGSQPLYGAIGAAIFLLAFLVVSYLVHLILAVIRQRDEARKQYSEMTEQRVFLDSIKSGDIIKDREIDIPLLFKERMVLNGVAFEHCTLRGPAIIGLVKNNEVSRCHFLEKIDSYLIKAEPGRKYIGVPGLLGCRLFDCIFEQLGILANQETINDFIKDITIL